MALRTSTMRILQHAARAMRDPHPTTRFPVTQARHSLDSIKPFRETATVAGM
jgi:hypothetical protein